ncbi:MAG: hypothetical protein A3F89_05370 [Deltaproteobacteria bacterium RIFCSPLOWO2_12_FULL_50_11]|nr:MAG: hypothetical protein A3F89_05370 [Deltaproteobacteria bacterium RIFCSPLOWO2_12_FULL_50_11]
MGRIYHLRFLRDPTRLFRKKSLKNNAFLVKDHDFILSEAGWGCLKDLKKGKCEVVQSWTPEEHQITPFYSEETLLEAHPPPDVIDEVVAATMARRLRGHDCTPMYRGRSLDNIPNTFLLDRPRGQRNYRWSWETGSTQRRSFKEYFQNIIAAATEPQTRFVISLGAGGLRLFAHASLMRILNSLDLKSAIDEIWGCSGGAIAGLFYAMGVDPETIEKEGYDIYNRKYEFSLRPSKRELIKNAVTNALFPSNPFALKGLMNIQEGLNKIISRVIEEKDLRLQIPFFSIAYNLHKKMNQVLTPWDIDTEPYQGLIQKTTAMDAILASSSIPILYVPKVIRTHGDSHIYVDGGTAEEVPLLTIHRKWKIDQRKNLTDKKRMFILAVNLFPEVSHLKIFRHKFFRKLPFMDILKWGSHLADLVRQARIEDHLHILRDDPSVIVKQVTLTYPAPGVLEPTSIPNMISRARRSFFKQLLMIDKELGSAYPSPYYTL